MSASLISLGGPPHSTKFSTNYLKNHPGGEMENIRFVFSTLCFVSGYNKSSLTIALKWTTANKQIDGKAKGHLFFCSKTLKRVFLIEWLIIWPTEIYLASFLQMHDTVEELWFKLSLQLLINPSHLAQSAEDSNRTLTTISVTVWESESIGTSKWPSLNIILAHELYLNPQPGKIWWMFRTVIHPIQPRLGVSQRRMFHRVSCSESSPVMRGHQIGGITLLVGLSWSQMPFEFSNIYVRARQAKRHWLSLLHPVKQMSLDSNECLPLLEAVWSHLAQFCSNCLGSIGKNPTFWKLGTSCVPTTCFPHQTGVAWPMVMELQPNLCQKTGQLWHQWQAIEAPCRVDKKEANTAITHPFCLTLRFDCLHVWINKKHWFFQVDRVGKWHQPALRPEAWQMGEKQHHGCPAIPCHPVFSLFDP